MLLLVWISLVMVLITVLVSVPFMYFTMKQEEQSAGKSDDEMDLMEQRDLNYAIWDWEPSWEPWASEVHDFNFRFGTNPNNLEDTTDNALLDVIKSYWQRNSIFPSDF